MNHKPAPPPPLHHPPATSPRLHCVEDIPFSDIDTFPEFSNRDGSKERTDKCYQLMMVRVPEVLPDVQRRAITETINAELRITWKTPATAFTFFAAPHVPILHVAHSNAKKCIGEKAQIRSSQFFAEPKNDKLPIVKEPDLRNLKFEVIFGAAKFNYTKPENHHDVAKRIETTLFEVMRCYTNVVLFLGPMAFDVLFDSLEKQKKKPGTPHVKQLVVVVENFRWMNNEWKRVLKGGATSVSVPLPMKPM